LRGGATTLFVIYASSLTKTEVPGQLLGPVVTFITGIT
jgi:hypothetical protein